MGLPADVIYRRSEVDLEELERTSFRILRNSIPDYYRDGRDDTLSGRVLRSAARLLAQADYQNQYLLAGIDPSCLTPADLLRQYGKLLGLNRNYPGKTQYDLDFKDMVLKLLAAYRLGATAKSLKLVLEAYTGTSYTLEELFKSITPGGDISDRNAIRVGLGVSSGSEGFTDAVVRDIAKVADTVKDLYAAIDLAKPAHIGINLTTTLRDDAERIALGISDDLTITVLFEEAEPGDLLLYEAPFMNVSTPRTGLGPETRSFTYQWFRNSVAITGATAPDYIFSAALGDDGVGFSVQVSQEDLGQCQSSTAHLTVSPLGTTPLPRATAATPSPVSPTGTLRITAHPTSRSVVEGAQVIFSVSARNETVPGILSPHLNQCWEVAEDLLIGLDLD